MQGSEAYDMYYYYISSTSIALDLRILYIIPCAATYVTRSVK